MRTQGCSSSSSRQRNEFACFGNRSLCYTLAQNEDEGVKSLEALQQ